MQDKIGRVATLQSEIQILGIDPGSTYMGLGTIQKKGQKLEYVNAEVLTAKASDSLFIRLELLSEKLREYLKQWRPEQVAIENVFYGKNVKSAFHLGLSRGVALAACFEYKVPIFEYSPNQVKSAVTGHGKADKEQVKKMTEFSLGKKITLRYDATDALAVAICHASRIRPLLQC